MTSGARALIAAALAGMLFVPVGLALERNPWVALAGGAVIGALVFLAVYSYYAQTARLTLPHEVSSSGLVIPLTTAWRTRRLVASGRLDEAGRRLTVAGDWVGANRLITTNVSIRQAREPLVRLLEAVRSLEGVQQTLPAETPDVFRGLTRETSMDVSQRLWAKTAMLARLSAVALPAAGLAEVTAEGRRIDDLATQVEAATTDLLRLSLAGYDPHGIRQGTELLSALKRKAEVLLRISGDDLR